MLNYKKFATLGIVLGLSLVLWAGLVPAISSGGTTNPKEKILPIGPVRAGSNTTTVNANAYVYWCSNTSISYGYQISWSFSAGQPIEVMAMGAADFANFSSNYPYNTYVLSSGSYTSGSGIFTTQLYYSQLFIVFKNVGSAATSLTDVVDFVTSPPSAPRSFYVYAYSNEIELTWSAPATTGGAPVTQYYIYRSTYAGGENYYATTTSLYFYDYSTSAGNTYYYKVYAVNTYGTSPASTEAFASTSQGSVPGAPSSLSATVYSNEIKLSWTPPSYTGGSPVTQYYIYRSTYAGGESFYGSTTSPYFYDSDVSSGTTYYYTVYAVNSAGTGLASNEVFESVSTSSNTSYDSNLSAEAAVSVVIIVIICVCCIAGGFFLSKRSVQSKASAGRSGLSPASPSPSTPRTQSPPRPSVLPPKPAAARPALSAEVPRKYFCPGCGASHTGGDKFCKFCGTAWKVPGSQQPASPGAEKNLTPRQDAPVPSFCYNCGSTHAREDHFCKECGVVLKPNLTQRVHQ